MLGRAPTPTGGCCSTQRPACKEGPQEGTGNGAKDERKRGKKRGRQERGSGRRGEKLKESQQKIPKMNVWKLFSEINELYEIVEETSGHSSVFSPGVRRTILGQDGLYLTIMTEGNRKIKTDLVLSRILNTFVLYDTESLQTSNKRMFSETGLLIFFYL